MKETYNDKPYHKNPWLYNQATSWGYPQNTTITISSLDFLLTSLLIS